MASSSARFARPGQCRRRPPAPRPARPTWGSTSRGGARHRRPEQLDAARRGQHQAEQHPDRRRLARAVRRRGSRRRRPPSTSRSSSSTATTLPNRLVSPWVRIIAASPRWPGRTLRRAGSRRSRCRPPASARRRRPLPPVTITPSGPTRSRRLTVDAWRRPDAVQPVRELVGLARRERHHQQPGETGAVDRRRVARRSVEGRPPTAAGPDRGELVGGVGDVEDALAGSP